MKRLFLIVVAFLMLQSLSANGNLKGNRVTFVSADTAFRHPFIDVDKVIAKPVRCRYIHGGFDNGTRFSFYFPLKKSDYEGRFFQYIAPFPDSETSAQNFPTDINPIAFSITHGAYFVETNEGGLIDFTHLAIKHDPTIGAYRANAACAEFSRAVAKAIYSSSQRHSPSPIGEGRGGASISRPFGYCYGGSGGAYRTVGGIESTQGVWDGAVPYVLGSPQAIPNVFSVRMNALRILRDKMADIVDAMQPGGSGDPYATLNVEQRQVLHEATAMGFPIKSWYGYKFMNAHGFTVLYRSVVARDPSYFRHDFWHTPGYLGYDNPPSLSRDHVVEKAVITKVIGQTEAERLHIVEPMSEADRGSADRAWAAMGTEIKERPVAFRLDHGVTMNTLGGELVFKGNKLQITEIKDSYAIPASVNDPKLLAMLHEGDSVVVDNSDWLASETYYRHQVPSPDYYVWNQFRSFDGKPIYPQRKRLLGPSITKSAAGCLPTGNIHCKIILCESAYDREAFPWQADWYRTKVRQHLGAAAEDNFRLWYTDRAIHGYPDDSTEVVSYDQTVFQALLDLSQWVEKGIEPSKTTDYKIEDGQVMLAPNGSERGGIQPVPTATCEGSSDVAYVSVSQPVTINVKVDVPKGTGKIVKAEWCLGDTKHYTRQQDLSKAKYSDDGSHVEFSTTVSYDHPGTYFPTVRVWSERNGDANTTYTRIPNLAKVRVVVK